MFSTIADVCAWTPWGAPFQLPMDVASGNWLGFIGRLLICIATVALAFMISVWCLRRDRLRGEDSKVSVARGLGWLARVPDSVSGAVSGRVAQYWQRDGRFAMGLIMPVILTVIFIFQARNASMVMWMAPLTIGLVYPMIEANNLAYDGMGFTLHAIAGVRGRDDRLGRARVNLVVSLFFVIVTSLIAMYMTHAFTDAAAFRTSIAGLGGGIGFVAAGIGLAEVLSTLLIYPVPSADKPFSSPQGRGAAQGFFPMIQMVGSLLLMLPTFGVLIAILVSGNSGLLWVVGLVALLNGVGFLILGIYLGGRILDRRIPAILQTLSNYESLQK